MISLDTLPWWRGLVDRNRQRFLPRLLQLMPVCTSAGACPLPFSRPKLAKKKKKKKCTAFKIRHLPPSPIIPTIIVSCLWYLLEVCARDNRLYYLFTFSLPPKTLGDFFQYDFSFHYLHLALVIEGQAHLLSFKHHLLFTSFFNLLF